MNAIAETGCDLEAPPAHQEGSAEARILCAVFDRRALRAAIDYAARSARQRSARLTVLSCHSTSLAWAGSLGWLVGVSEGPSPSELALGEMEAAVAGAVERADLRWLSSDTQLTQIVEALLGEGLFALAVIGCRHGGRRGRLAARLRERASRQCEALLIR